MAAKSNEIKIKRIYDAPLKTVWEAWTDERQTEKWWGPRGWWIKSHSKDLRPGGQWKYDMFGPNGEKFENVTLYHVVEPLARLEYDHGGGVDRPPLFRVTVTFKDIKGKTEMVMTMALESDANATETKKFIKNVGGNSTWDRLAEHLSERPKFVINRTFKAPIETMYDVWTKPEHIAKWLPPTGMEMEYMETDVRVGGRSLYKMTNGKDITMYGSTTYRELSPVTRVVYDQDFRDENDRLSRHPFLPLWPESMRTTVTLADQGDGFTRVTIEWVPSENATIEEVAEFVKARAGMSMGWTGSLNKLEAMLGVESL